MAKKAIQIANALLSLATLVAATQSQTGFMFAAPDAIQPLIDSGDAEINMEMVNPDNAGEFAARATAQGIMKAMNEQTTSTTTDTTAPATNGPATDTGKPSFARAVRVQSAKPKRAGNGVGIYPWGDLAAPTTNEAGETLCDGFFVPATPAKPKPEESLQSAISAANRSYGTKTGEKTISRKGKVINGVQQPDTIVKRGEYTYSRKFAAVAGEHEGVKGAWVERVQ